MKTFLEHSIENQIGTYYSKLNFITNNGLYTPVRIEVKALEPTATKLIFIT